MLIYQKTAEFKSLDEALNHYELLGYREVKRQKDDWRLTVKLQRDNGDMIEVFSADHWIAFGSEFKLYDAPVASVE